MYQEMASRHRVRASSVSIIKTATVPAALCKRDNVKQFHDSKISFPVTHKLARWATQLQLSHQHSCRICVGRANAGNADWYRRQSRLY
jgi:hypothetical protein